MNDYQISIDLKGDYGKGITGLPIKGSPVPAEDIKGVLANLSEVPASILGVEVVGIHITKVTEETEETEGTDGEEQVS